VDDDNQKARIEALTAFLDEDPEDHFSRYALALEHKSAGRPEEAVAALEDIRRRDPSYLPLYYQLAVCLMEVRRDRDALAAAEAGVPVARAAGNAKTLAELETLAAEIRTELA